MGCPFIYDFDEFCVFSTGTRKDKVTLVEEDYNGNKPCR